MKTESKLFTIIVGDLARSRYVPNRARFADKVRLAIAQLKEEFIEEFQAPLALTQGIDELSGVLKRPNESYQICTRLNKKLFPNHFRFAIVRGVIDVAATSREAREMDGPGFHVAATLVDLAKKENRCYYFRLGLQLPEGDQLLTELANLIRLLRSNWTPHQRSVVDIYIKFKHQKIVAEKLNITQQAVSDALKCARWWDIKQAQDILEKILKHPSSYK